MRKQTCPWCGKSLESHKIKNIPTRKAFMRFIIARCVHCNNVYGQNYNLDSIWPSVFLFIIFVILTLTVHYCFIFGILLSLYLTDYVPFSRFDNRFDPIKDNRQLHKLTVVSGNIRKKRYYLTDNFDVLPCFSTVSPIEIRKIKKNTAYFLFTYEHNDNAHIFNNEITLYDISGASPAVIKVNVS